MAETIRCDACGTMVSVGHKFCGGCGAVLDPIEGSGASQQTWFCLRLIQEDGSDGELYELSEKGVMIGRTEGEIRFPHDLTVSPVHATFKYTNGKLVVRDLKSCNGTFVRIRDPETISEHDVFQCGEQFIRFEKVSWLLDKAEVEALSQPGGAPKFLSTPRRAWRYRLSQVVASHEHGLVYCSVNSSTTIGRDGCDVNFPADQFISGKHCAIEQQGTLFYLKDLQSRNGTFLKIRAERTLHDGDSLFIGRQLLRVEARRS